MQKSFTEDFLTGKRKKNEGELAMYFIENDHEAIVSRDVFNLFSNAKQKIVICPFVNDVRPFN